MIWQTKDNKMLIIDQSLCRCKFLSYLIRIEYQ